MAVWVRPAQGHKFLSGQGRFLPSEAGFSGRPCWRPGAWEDLLDLALWGSALRFLTSFKQGPSFLLHWL